MRIELIGGPFDGEVRNLIPRDTLVWYGKLHDADEFDYTYLRRHSDDYTDRSALCFDHCGFIPDKDRKAITDR